MSPIKMLYKYLDSLSEDERKLAIYSLSSSDKKKLAQIHSKMKAKK